MKRTLLALSIGLSLPAFGAGLTFRESAVEYANALDNVEIIATAMQKKLSEVEQVDQSIEAAREQVQSLKNQAQQLRQDADDIQNAANAMPNPPPQPQNANPGGAGGGSGAGGGGKGGGMEGKEPPKLGESPKMENPPTVAEQMDIGDIASKLAFNPGRGIDTNRTEFTSAPFDPNAFRLKNGNQAPGGFTPGDVAAGKFPQLQGATSVGTPIADANAGAAANSPAPTSGSNPPGMGGLGGGMGSGGGSAAGGGDNMASVGGMEAEEPSPKINTETMATGAGGEGGENTATVANTTGEPDESPVARQKSNGNDTIVVASERKIENPEAHGLMTYVGTGWVKELREVKKIALVLASPGTAVASMATPVVVELAGRALASTPIVPLDVAPVEAAVGTPQRSERRAGILGLLSGK